MNPHDLSISGFSYHFGFRRPLGSWSGLCLHHGVLCFRCPSSSLYTFLFRGLARRWLAFAGRSPNLEGSASRVSSEALIASPLRLPFRHPRMVPPPHPHRIKFLKNRELFSIPWDFWYSGRDLNPRPLA